MFEDLPVAVQTGYAQLLEALASRELHRTAGSLSGTFSRKSIDGRAYWYYTYRLPGAGVQQAFVGPDSERMRALIKTAGADVPAGNIPLLLRAYLQMGGSAAPPQQVSLLRHLADAGFFRAGGVLVGTHAFLCYANVLGVRWPGHDQTTDVDLGWSDRSVSIVLPASPKVDLDDALSTFESGFVPASIIGKGLGAAYHSSKDPDFRVDFLTTLSRSGRDARRIEALNVIAQPLPYMEFSLEGPIQAVIFDRRGRSALVNVPPPARYAVHKLIVSDQRGASYRSKVAKDLAQAASLVSWFAAHDPAALIEARGDARGRGPSWRRALQAGWKKLEREYPEVVEAFAAATR